MSINHETRERYRKATAAASPGPWLTCWDAPDPDTDDSFRDGAGDKVISAQGLTAYLACSRSNAAFIATAREAMPAYDAALTEALAEIARLRLSTSDLHRRTQQAESWAEAKHVETRRRLATLEQAWKNAKKWTEEMDMRADWAHNPRSLYWPMTSANNAAALAVLVAQRDEALVEVEALKESMAIQARLLSESAAEYRAKWNASEEEGGRLIVEHEAEIERLQLLIVDAVNPHAKRCPAAYADTHDGCDCGAKEVMS